MANEIHIDYESGHTLYTAIRNSSSQVWYPTGQSFEAWGTSGRGANDYDISLAGDDGCRYIGDFDINIPAGRYTVQVFLQAGDNPADGDELIGNGEIIWTGIGELTADKVLANKAIQNKSTGVINYYDDDGETIILTHIPSDGESTLTRTPS